MPTGVTLVPGSFVFDAAMDFNRECNSTPTTTTVNFTNGASDHVCIPLPPLTVNVSNFCGSCCSGSGC